MEKFAVVLIIVTAFWGIIGIIAPLLVPKGPDRRLTQLMLTLTAVACYIFWACIYLHQYQPLFGPEMKSDEARAVRTLWGKTF